MFSSHEDKGSTLHLVGWSLNIIEKCQLSWRNIVFFLFYGKILDLISYFVGSISLLYILGFFRPKTQGHYEGE